VTQFQGNSLRCLIYVGGKLRFSTEIAVIVRISLNSFLVLHIYSRCFSTDMSFFFACNIIRIDVISKCMFVVITVMSDCIKVE